MTPEWHIPEWFTKAIQAYDRDRNIENIWAEVLYEGFRQFPFNRSDPNTEPGAVAWDPDTCCMGSFNPAFDQQPGIAECRKRWAAVSLAPDQLKIVSQRLLERGIVFP